MTFLWTNKTSVVTMNKIVHMSSNYEEIGYCHGLDLFNHLTSVARFMSYKKREWSLKYPFKAHLPYGLDSHREDEVDDEPW